MVFVMREITKNNLEKREATLVKIDEGKQYYKGGSDE